MKPRSPSSIDAALAKKLADREDRYLFAGRELNPGHINPYFQIIDEVTSIFLDMGYEVVEGRDVETDHFNFELLNVPKDHPARDMQDTFYISDELLLRPRLRRPKPTRWWRKGKAYPRSG
jgi:phenylalanyl-tRNA synthetase alpha chain